MKVVRKFQIFFILLVMHPLFQGCGTGLAVGSRAGVSIAEERGLGGNIDDAAITAKITTLWLQHDPKIFLNVSSEVYERKVLLTGVVDNLEHRLEAAKLVWQIDKVKEVINEIHITGGGVNEYLKSSWTTAKLLRKITFHKKILSINYNIETVNQIIYIMGIAQNQEELDRVVQHAKNIANVKKVISYVRIKR